MDNDKNLMWKDIPGYEGYYQVSSGGRIKSLARGPYSKEKILKIRVTSRGYDCARLFKNGKSKQHSVHRLVMLAFVGTSLLQVNHKNLNQLDNRLENLEYVTPSENILHAARHGRMSRFGHVNGSSKLSGSQVEEIHSLNGVLKHAEIANMFGVTPSRISAIIRSGFSKLQESDAKPWKML